MRSIHQNPNATCDLCNCYCDERSMVHYEIEGHSLFLGQCCDGDYDDDELLDIILSRLEDNYIDEQVDNYLLTKGD